MDARPDRVDLRDRPYNPKLQSLSEEFPSKQWVQEHFRSYLNFILDQGEEGACTGFGLAACVNYLLWKRAIENAGSDNGTTFTAKNIVSPWMLYHLARQYDEWDGDEYDGSSCRGAMKGWHKHGATSMNHWPRSLKPQEDGSRKPDPKSRPREDWAIDAIERPLGAYYRVEKTSIADMQAAVAEVGAVYCSASVHAGWQVLPKRSDPISGVADLSRIVRRLPSRDDKSTHTHFDWAQWDAILDAEHLNELDDPKYKSPFLHVKPGDAMPVVGGHAFAIVGFCRKGFVVQNSWGTRWGWNGFGLLSYDDWADHAMDAWVAVLGAPFEKPAALAAALGKSKKRTTLPQVPMTRSGKSLQQSLAGMTSASYSQASACEVSVDKPAPLSVNEAYARTVVVGNNGVPINRFVDEPNGEAAVARVVDFAVEQAQLLAKHMKARKQGDGTPRVLIYAHGGLNKEEASIQRIRKMAPVFEANGIAPIFATWRTGVIESIMGWASDKFEAAITPSRAESVWGRAITYLDEQKDRAIEGVAHEVMVRAIWSEMKQNAEDAASSAGGVGKMLEQLLAQRASKKFELHVVGHSAGAILLGHVLQQLRKSDVIESCTLFAPACTMELASKSYVPPLKSKQLRAMHVDLLSDDAERDDTVGPYGKSLLYLVSRALERQRKCPLLGMERAWDASEYQPGDLSWDRDTWQYANVGDALMKAGANRAVHFNTVKDDTKALTGEQPPRSVVAHLYRGELVRMHVDGASTTKLAHGSFDNDILVLDSTVRRVLGQETTAMLDDRTLSQRPALTAPVQDLTPMEEE